MTNTLQVIKLEIQKCYLCHIFLLIVHLHNLSSTIVLSLGQSVEIC